MTSISFRAVVEPARGGGHVVEVDPAMAGKIGAKHRTRVRGTLAGAEYRSNLISMGGRLVLGVHKATLQAAGRAAGETVAITLSPDADPLPNDEVPEVLARALERNPQARAAFDAMPPSHRRRFVGYVTEAKREETRRRRAKEAIERMIVWARERGR